MGENEVNSIDHKERLSSFSKEALIEEVLNNWDALAKSEASMGDMQIKIKMLEIEIAKLSAIRGVSSTKVEMSERINQLEGMLRIQEKYRFS